MDLWVMTTEEYSTLNWVPEIDTHRHFGGVMVNTLDKRVSSSVISSRFHMVWVVGLFLADWSPLLPTAHYAEKLGDTQN